jgi:hypothetical protein
VSLEAQCIKAKGATLARRRVSIRTASVYTKLCTNNQIIFEL